MMRSAEQISRTPEQWADFKERQRRRALADLLDHLERSRHAEWYRWATEGQPELTPAEYEFLCRARARTERR